MRKAVLVPRLPTALAATGAMVLAALSLVAGLILDAVTRARLELRRLHYLNYAAPGEHLGENLARETPAQNSRG